MSIVNVNIVEDKSVINKIKKTQSKLSKRYSRKETKENFFTRKKSIGEKILSISLTVVCVVAIAICLMLSINVVANSIRHTPPCFCGYSFMSVVTESMTADTITINGKTYASGHPVGDKIIVRKVRPETLKIGDKIAFYVYVPNYTQFHNVEKSEIEVGEDTKTKYQTQFWNLLGVHTKDINNAAKDGAKPVFHHITKVYKDANGKYWFKTQGSANAAEDAWFVSEEMIVGSYVKSGNSNTLMNIFNFSSSTVGKYVIIIIPVVLLAILLTFTFAKDFQLSLIELDVVQEKRKLTDDICVRNKIGLRMSKSVKYKVLAQATPEEVPEYILLLWKDGNAPEAIKKYYSRKRIQLASMKKMLELNRVCEEEYKNNKDINKITTYYLKEKEKIEKEQERLNHLLNSVHRRYIKNEKES